MVQPKWTTLLYATICFFAVSANGALTKTRRGYPSRAVVLQGKHDTSRASVLSRYPHGTGFGSIRGNSRSVSGKLNSIDSKRIHSKLQSTVGKALDRRSKNSLINSALRRVSKISDFHTMPGLPVGTVSGKKLPSSRHHHLRSKKKLIHLMKTGRGAASTGGLSIRSRSRKGHLGRKQLHHRRRGSKLISSHHGAQGEGSAGLSVSRRASLGALGTRTGHLDRGASHLDALHLSEHAGSHLDAGIGHHGSLSHTDLSSAGHLGAGLHGQHSLTHPKLPSSRLGHAELSSIGLGHAGLSSSGLGHAELASSALGHADLRSSGQLGSGIHGQPSLSHPEISSSGLAHTAHTAQDAHLISSLVDQGSQVNPDVASFLPNFVADEPKIFLDKQSSVKNTYPQIVVGRPEPLLAAPVLPLSLGSDGHVLTSSNTQTNEVLKSVLSTLTSSKSLTQQAIAVLLQSIRNAIDQQNKSVGVGFKGPKIKLSPIIHAGANAVTSENIIKIKEPDNGSTIVLKTGGQLEISSGVPGKPTFKIYGIKPSTLAKVFKEDDTDDEKKRKLKIKA